MRFGIDDSDRGLRIIVEQESAALRLLGAATDERARMLPRPLLAMLMLSRSIEAMLATLDSATPDSGTPDSATLDFATLDLQRWLQPTMRYVNNA
jgi:hypothetical protein